MRRALLDKYFIFGACFLRALGIGMIAVLLAIYLAKTGLSKTQIGLVISVGLLGAACGNLFVTFFGDRLGRRKVLVFYSLVGAIGAVCVAICPNIYAILAAAFLSMLNARGKDRGAALVLESAMLPNIVKPEERTKAFAWYSLSQDIGLAIGAIAAGIPTLLASHLGITELLACQYSFGLYAALMLLSGCLYFYLSAQTEVPVKQAKISFSPEGKKVVMKLSALFGVDSLAGGFLTSSLIAYYFYERFDLTLATVGGLFFAGKCLNAVSYFAAAWLSKKIGLIRTMVFTHLPSHLCLIAIAFAPSFPIAVLFFLMREFLVEMDVPTKKSYLMAVTQPEERTAASGITQMVRMGGWAVAPVFAGYVMQEVAFSSPLFIGAGIKIVYDILVYFSLRKVMPAEEIVVKA